MSPTKFLAKLEVYLASYLINWKFIDSVHKGLVGVWSWQASTVISTFSWCYELLIAVRDWLEWHQLPAESDNEVKICQDRYLLFVLQVSYSHGYWVSSFRTTPTHSFLLFSDFPLFGSWAPPPCLWSPAGPSARDGTKCCHTETWLQCFFHC